MTEDTHKRAPLKFAMGATIVQERAHTTSDEDLAAINQFTLTPVSAADVAVFRMDLCNDQMDRHISRFPTEELRRISDELIVGKPLMELHDMNGSQPVGRFFRSQLANENGTVSVRPDVFLLRGHGEDDLIAKIDAGICAGTSISFAFDRPECSACGCDIRDCAHIPGDDVDGEQCHVVLKEVTDVFEGSIVAVPSQSTEFVQARGVDDEGEIVLGLRDAIKQARSMGTETNIPIQSDDDHPATETAEEIIVSIEEGFERVHAVSRTLHTDLT